ncbi:MAG: PKD domain-containing protein, partial [Candidatus Cloacimonas sp.]
AGNNYVIGRFYGTATFGNTTMTSSGYSDIFIAKLREPVCFVTPNGGEGWFWPSVQVIQWLTYGQYDVNIKLSIDNGATWTILNEEPVSSTVGEYFFTVPYVISNQCLIRVESADGSRYITSNSCFSIGKLINPNLSVNLNDRTKFRRKESCEIGWEAEGIDYINIEYLLEGTWQNIASSVPVSEGSYFWSVPEVSFDDKCLIRVSDTYNPESIAFSDPFIVCKLDLISPNGEEFWCSQTEQTISWASENIDEIKLEYTIDDGDNWDLIADNISASIGFFQWEVPSTNSHLCRVKITDISEEEISSTSESPFTISPQIILNNLNEEEVLLVNTVFIISWSSCSDVTSVLIDYSIDGGENWLPIQTTPYPATVGLYYWLVPNTPSENCLLKVIRSDNSEVYSISELPFSIVTELKPPVVDFTSDITSGYEPLEIQFTDLSLPMTGKLKSWLWEFGNGDESEEQHPVYVYEDPGIYSVTLTVTSSIDSTATLTFNDYIEILARYAEIEIEYEDMIFPSTYLGANSYPLSILIKNNGNKGLDITQFMFLNDESDFFVEALELPVIIPVEDSLSVDICFSPRSAGRLIDTLFIHNNSVNTPIYSIELRGDGEYVPPKRPTNVQAIDSGDDMVISWDEVTETIFDTPIEPDAYLVFYNGSENPDSEYYFHGDTTETEYVHRNVGKYARHMFYKVYAYKYYGEARASLASFGLKRDMSVSEVKEILRKADYGLLGVQELKTNTK